MLLIQVLESLTEPDFKLIQNAAKTILLDSSRPINPDSVSMAWTEAVIYFLNSRIEHMGLDGIEAVPYKL